MKQVKSASVTVSAACLWLLAGCSPQPAEQQHGLNADSRLRVAEAAEASGDRQTALSMYAAAANDAPGDTSTQLRSAEGLARNGGLADASALLARRLKATPHDANLLGALGALQIMAGEPGKAVATLSDVLATRPTDMKALVNKAVALDILRKHDAAQGLYRQALVLTPGDVTVSNDLALSLMLSGRREEARQILAPFRTASNLPERVTTNLGILDAASGHPAEARQALGSRIGSGDLASLTQAISMQTGSFQPDDGGRAVSRGALSDQNSAYEGPVPHSVSATSHGGSEEQRGHRAEPVVLYDAPAVTHASGIPVVRAEPIASPDTPAAAHVGKPVAHAALAEVVMSHDEPGALHGPETVKLAAQGAAASRSGVAIPSGGSIPKVAVAEKIPADTVSAPRHLVQTPQPTLATTVVSAEGAVAPHRPLQEQVAGRQDPVAHAVVAPVSNRPLQEQASPTADIASSSPH